MKLAIIGGDERALRLARLCRAAGYSVTTLGLERGDERTCAPQEASVLLFPYPYAVKNGMVPCKTGLDIDPAEVLALARSDAMILTGQGLEPYIAAARVMGKTLPFFAYEQDEAFIAENAEISAEGAVSYAMQQTDDVLMGKRCVVVGYGRIGSGVARRLQTLDAKVTVAARREESRLLARSRGLEACGLEDLAASAAKAQFLINTVPVQVIDEAVLRALPEDALILELASAPYGLDFAQARQIGRTVALLPGIPGTYAPAAAARALYRALLRKQ